MANNVTAKTSLPSAIFQALRKALPSADLDLSKKKSQGNGQVTVTEALSCALTAWHSAKPSCLSSVPYKTLGPCLVFLEHTSREKNLACMEC